MSTQLTPRSTKKSTAADANEVPAKKTVAKDRQFVTALARGLQVLGCFTTARPELSGSEIARLTGLPQPTVWRLCYTMVKTGTLVPTAGERFRPGLSVLHLGHSAIAGMNLVELARPHMQELANEFRGACSMAVCHGLNMMVIERVESNNELLMSLRAGSVLSVAESSFGWAHLAGLRSQDRLQLLAQLDEQKETFWIQHRTECLESIQQYEKLGYILSAGVFHSAYNTLAAPIIAPDGNIPYVLNCGSSAATVSAKQLQKQVAPRFLELVQQLTSLLALQR
ncbi:IclR family transcriptional regulator [Diaphorobacter sp. HDW4A]|uniref:IclR family transcriptional regulator n=1 Tax=Diaphorobacter sp. HDW4A TaxID=2714924 RepID=UPI0014076B75|nr:IclR family transcriptional regulator [Diaphorobacter sp. HDW4A]QIL80009.1 IclR family transcriptional regulator [Diaphorobacter sp. HDW4A]